MGSILCELHFADLGTGWGAAVLETENEYDFLKQGQKSFSKSDSYWINGTTDNMLGEAVSYSDYFHNNSGKLIKSCCF